MFKVVSIICLLFVVPAVAWASCPPGSHPNCDPGLDAKVIPAKVSCYRNNTERLDIEFSQGSACEYLPKDGFYACYHGTDKKDKWREMYCQNKKSIGIGLEYFYDKIVAVEVPIGPGDDRIIKQIELPPDVNFSEIEKWHAVP